MKKIWVVLLSFLIAMGIWLWISKKRIQKTEVQEPLTTLVKKPLPKLPLPRTQGTAGAAPSKPQEEISEECRHFYNEIRSLDFTDLKIEKLPTESRCQPSDPTLKDLQVQMFKNCKPEKDPVACSTAAWMLRLQISRMATRDLDISKTQDLRLLVEKFLAVMTEAGQNPSFFSDFQKIGDRIEQLRPNLPDVAKLQATNAMFQVLDVMENGTSEQKGAAWKNLETRVEQASRLNPGDSQVAEAEIWSKTRFMEAPESAKQIEEFARSHPNSGLGHYYLAMIQAKKGEKAQALAELHQAIAKDPKDSRFQETLKSCQEKEKCNFRINLNFKLEEILR